MSAMSTTVPYPPPVGVWVAYYHDKSAVLVFGSELEALRHSNDHGGMVVRFVKFGHDITDEVQS